MDRMGTDQKNPIRVKRYLASPIIRLPTFPTWEWPEMSLESSDKCSALIKKTVSTQLKHLVCTGTKHLSGSLKLAEMIKERKLSQLVRHLA